MKPQSSLILAIPIAGAMLLNGKMARCDGPNADVTALLAKAAAAYRNFQSLSFNMEDVMLDENSHKSETITTKVNLVKPKRMTADLNGKQGHLRVVADGKSIFTSSSHDSSKYFKAADTGNVAVVQALSSAGGCGIGLLAVLLTDPKADTKIIQSNSLFVRRAADTMIGSDKCDVVSAESKNGSQLILYTFAFGKSDHFLRRLSVSDPKQATSPMFTETYSAVKINPTISESLFRFSAPKGAVAIDPTVPPKSYDARIKVGATPIPINGSDLSGNKVALADYKGKVLLLDFWATWCGPCVHELPNVVQAYNKYHAQGFDVVGITLDQANAKEKVQQFVKANQMPWRQIYDGKYWSAANAAAYGISAIPFTLLIGRDGKVAAIGARGPALAPAIEAALKRK